MKLKPWMWIAAIAVLTAVMPVQAQMGARHRQAPAGDDEQAQERLRLRDEAAREQRHRELRQAGRMTPEERRQLRRDIHEAGRELYRRRGERPSE